MASYDINRLRQQNIMGGGIMGGGMDYQPIEDPFQSQPQTAPMIPQQAPQPRMTAPQLPVQQPYPPIQQSQYDLRMPTPTYGLPGQQQQPVETDIQGLIDMVNNAYTPQTRASDRFNQLLDAFPERQEPGLGTRLIGATAFLGNKSRGIPGGYEIQDKVMNAPFYRDVAAWKEKAGPFQQGAQIENTSNNIERQVASNLVTGAVNTRRYNDQQSIAEAKQAELTRSNIAKEEIARSRNAILDYKARNPDAKFDFSGPFVMIADPKTKEVRSTGIPTGHMTDLDKINLNQTNAMARIGAQGANSLANVRAGGAILVQDADGNQYYMNPRTQEPMRPTTPTTPPQPTGPVDRVGTGGKEQEDTPTQANARMQNKLRELYYTDPVGRKWITKEGDTYELKEPPKMGSWFKYDEEDAALIREFNSIKDKIFPKTGGTEAKVLPPNQSMSVAPPKSPNMSSRPTAEAPPPVPGQQSTVGTRLSPAEKERGLQSGDLIVAYDSRGNKFVIANTDESIAEAKRRGYTVPGSK